MIHDYNHYERSMTMNATKSVAKVPICGMTVEEATAIQGERDGKTYYFRSIRCQQLFLSAPADAKPEDKSGCCCG